MTLDIIPEGEERKVEAVSSAAIDGAPIAYIVVLAAIVTTLSFIPFSIVLASGGSMPLSQAVFVGYSARSLERSLVALGP